jgi:hypothetical protein
MMVHTCNPSYSGDRDRRIRVQGWLRQKHKTLFEKQAKAKRDGGVFQVVKCLPNKWKALSLNPSGHQKKKS